MGIVKSVKKNKDIKKTLHPNTAMINKTQRDKSREAIRHVLTWLSTTFPKAFDIDGTIRPLKVGILSDILAYANEQGGLPFSMAKLRQALVVFTRRMEYLTCVKMRDIRIDLNGNEVDPVSEDAAKLAVERIKKIIEKNIRSKHKPTTTGARPARFSPRTAPPKRRFPHAGGQPAHNNHHQQGSHYENTPREHGNGYHNDYDAGQSATIKIKKRYIPRTYDTNPYSPNPAPVPEKNYNSESYNTEASTVDRLKAKLGLKPRRERFDYEE